MPDISNYSPDKPFNPHIFSTVNLNDVFIPSVELPEVNQPSGVNGYGDGDNAWSFFLRKSGRNPFANLGIVPAGPAASDDYWSNRKFSSEADSYQSGSTYKDIGYMIGRDNEDLFSRNRSWWDESFNTVVRLLDKAGAYSVQGFGFLGGLVGIGNKHDQYSSGSGFANWIAGASDNALSVWAKDVAEDVDDIYRPIYNEASDRDNGFWRRMLTDSEFWKGEATDAAGFLMSAYATGNLGKILDLGGKTIRGINAARGLSFAERAAALSDEGLSGLSKATNLSRGATVTETGAPVVASVTSPNAGGVYSRFLNEAGNFANARKINMGVSTLINTASEALFEATNVKDELVDRLSNELNADGTYKYTPQQVKDIAARGARNSFMLNMIALPLSNLWETKIFYGKANPLSARNAGNSRIRRQAGLLANAEVAKRTFGQRGVDILKNSAEGILKEGLWEENIQLAIERMNKEPENIDLGFMKNLGRVLNQYFNQTGGALSGRDTEASTSIGLGGIIGGGMSMVGNARDAKQVKRDVANYNAAINAFKASAKDMYEKNPDGSIRLDSNQQPVINATNALSYISSLNKTLSMSELADTLKDKNMNVLHSIVDNENISRLVKAYADNGQVDALIQKLDDAKGFKAEDLMLLGLNPDSAEGAKRLDEIKARAVEYKNIYDNIEKNFFVNIKNDDKAGSKARIMKDKLYYLSTRAANLGRLRDNLDTETQVESNELAARYPSESDPNVDRLNDLYRNYASAKKRVNQLSTEQRMIEDGRRRLEEFPYEISNVGEGMQLAQKKKTKAAPREEFTGVDEQELNDAVNQMNTAEQELKTFLEENKDSLKSVKRNADGTFRYENAERNKIGYESGLERKKDISKDLEHARNATLNVFNRLSDIKYGEKYFDEVYSKRKNDWQEQIVEDESDQTEDNLNDDPDQPQGPGGQLGLPPIPGQPQPGGGAGTTVQFQSPEDVQQAAQDVNNLKRERDILASKEDTTLEDDVRLDQLNKEIEDKEKGLDQLNSSMNEFKVDSSNNIPLNLKADYKQVLDHIEKDKRRVEKKDGYYLVDGERYGKVTDLIGDVVPDHLRPGLQNALNAGFTVDSVVKAYFDGTLNDDFKKEVATKISDEALNKLIQSLDVIKKELTAKGIEVIATNVVVFDKNLKVAGEIDILGVDKKGDFKVYEIEARQGHVWAQIATKTGRGPAIYEMTQKRLSAYRNLFANQYGIVPNTISVMFPINVKYDKKDPSGFIEKVALKPELRYTPTPNVQIKSNVFQPVKIGSKYDGIDLTKFYISTFIPKSMDQAKGKLRFLLRNETFDKIKKEITLTLKPGEQSFQEAYAKQQQVLQGLSVDGFSLKKIPDAPNLYALKGNMEFAAYYDGLFLGFMQPSPTIAYKDSDGKFKILDENTDLETYKAATGNSEQTYGEFQNISKAYKKAYNDLASRVEVNPLSYTGGSFSVTSVIPYTTPEINKYTPSQQLKFNQGDAFEPVRIVGNEDLIKLIELGSKLSSSDVTKRRSVNRDNVRKLEEQYKINAIDAYDKARALAKEHRGNIEIIMIVGTPSSSQVTLSPAEVQKMFDAQMSYGELDYVRVGEDRPDLNDLVIPGVKVGNKNVATVVQVDQNDNITVTMDKASKGKTASKKFYEIDLWANRNLHNLKNAMTNKRGEKVTDYVGIIETPDGKLHPIALRLKKGNSLPDNTEYVADLGTKFSSSTSKNVFKNESVALVPKLSTVEATISIKGDNIISQVYPTEDINAAEKAASNHIPASNPVTTQESVNNFIKGLTSEEYQKVNRQFAAFPMTSDELATEIVDDFQAGDWNSIDDYFEQLRCDL